ncbi:MAG: UDP-N-acetylmuramoyl-L-alanine--D-glutamate ligase [Methyloprofundus sp.]|nr:UDP-N-acetylmuramoyl-L-alanine--D-glutamate ligase [Methyloprofundus sp.]
MNNGVILKALDKQFSLNKEAAKVLVVGLGKTGLSVAYYLRQLGIQFAIVDSRDKPPFNDDLLAEMPDIPVFTGGFDAAVFALATHIVVSPGVSMEEPLIKQALARGVHSLSDIDLFACSVDKPIVAITGSNGKSTVTTMLGAMAKAAGKHTVVGGNLGTPALDLLADDVEIYVLELSSFQLERTTQLNAVAATILNVSADHLDRYVSIAAYAEQKRKVYDGNGVMLFNADDPAVIAMRDVGRNALTFGLQQDADYAVINIPEGEFLALHGRPILAVNELLVAGIHNQANALAALALGGVLGLPEEAMCEALRHYKGLKHRMQFVANIDGVSWVNDSKATNVGACVAALQGFKNADVILIAGGEAKGADMSELVPILKEKVKALLLIGKDGVLIKQAVNDAVPVYEVGTLKKAIKKAVKIAQSGDTVLLSPACASLDQFSNYQERGAVFIAEVKALEK